MLATNTSGKPLIDYAGEDYSHSAYLLCCELHNDLVEDLPIGLAEARNLNGNIIISDTSLQYLLPPKICKMTPWHKLMCAGCECCLTIARIQQSLNTWRGRLLKSILDHATKLHGHSKASADETRAKACGEAVFPGRFAWHSKPKRC